MYGTKDDLVILREFDTPCAKAGLYLAGLPSYGLTYTFLGGSGAQEGRCIATPKGVKRPPIKKTLIYARQLSNRTSLKTSAIRAFSVTG